MAEAGVLKTEARGLFCFDLLESSASCGWFVVVLIRLLRLHCKLLSTVLLFVASS